MTDPDELAQAFEAERGRLLRIASRVLGNQIDAEDVVQEAWLRLARQDPGVIENLAGWLTTVVGRLSIDVLRSRAAKRETALDDPFKDVVVTEDEDVVGEGPESAAVQADDVGLALLIVLDSLQPEERLAFVLHDLFALPFVEIGPIIGKSTDAAKMTASRARRKVRGSAPGQARQRQRTDQRAVVDAFLAAARSGDFDALLHILDPDLVWEVRTARGGITRGGRDDVLSALRRADPARVSTRRVLVNGQPGILAWGPSGRPVSLMACTIESGRMTRIDSLVDSARLAALDLPAAPPPGPERADTPPLR